MKTFSGYYSIMYHYGITLPATKNTSSFWMEINQWNFSHVSGDPNVMKKLDSKKGKKN